MTSAQNQPRRRRRRGSASSAGSAANVGPASAGPASAGSATEPGPAAGADSAVAPPPARAAGAEAGSRPEPSQRRRPEPNGGRRDTGRDSERSWRELAGSSPSQVGLGGALRARDVARPTAEDLAAAERSVVLVRRQWQPPES